jgi:hypothetical protein
MAERIVCSNCKTYYTSEMAFAHFRPGGTLCPECRRNKQLKESLEKSSSKSNEANQETKSQTVYVDRGPSADEIIAEAKAEKIEYELSKQKKQDSALTPWLFDENFSSTSRINSISFPNDVDNIEKTVERIIKAGVEQIKTTVNEHEMGVGHVQVGDKSFLKPFHEEFEFVEACFEKAQEGIKKLRRKDDSEHPKLKAIVNDLDDLFSDFKDKWFPKLIEKREKKKKKNIIVVSVMLILVIAFFSWAALR